MVKMPILIDKSIFKAIHIKIYIYIYKSTINLFDFYFQLKRAYRSRVFLSDSTSCLLCSDIFTMVRYD